MKGIIKLVILLLLLSLLNKPDSCAQNANSIQYANICSLINNPDVYNKREIKISGTYAVYANNSTFFSKICEESHMVWVTFDESLKQNKQATFFDIVEKMFSEASAHQDENHPSLVHVKVSEAEVVFIGEFKSQIPNSIIKNEILYSIVNFNPNTSDSFFEEELKAQYKYLFTVKRIESINLIKK